jgi:hypothetical protein
LDGVAPNHCPQLATEKPPFPAMVVAPGPAPGPAKVVQDNLPGTDDAIAPPGGSGTSTSNPPVVWFHCREGLNIVSVSIAMVQEKVKSSSAVSVGASNSSSSAEQNSKGEEDDDNNSNAGIDDGTEFILFIGKLFHN